MSDWWPNPAVNTDARLRRVAGYLDSLGVHMDTSTAIALFVLLPAIAMGVFVWLYNRFHSRRDADDDQQ
jgi:hypothetical protein